MTRAALVAACLLAGCSAQPPAEPGGWREPIRLHIDAAVPAPVADETRAVLGTLTRAAGVSVRSARDAATANVTVRLGAHCQTALWWTEAGALERAEVMLRLDAPRGITRCIHHELLHAMGLQGHPPGTASVLSYDRQAPHEVTHQDFASLRNLYSRGTP